MYMGLDAEWPRPNDGIAEKDDVGIPRIIAAYDGLDRDALFEWHATCRRYVCLPSLGRQEYGHLSPLATPH